MFQVGNESNNGLLVIESMFHVCAQVFAFSLGKKKKKCVSSTGIKKLLHVCTLCVLILILSIEQDQYAIFIDILGGYSTKRGEAGTHTLSLVIWGKMSTFVNLWRK